MKTILIAFALLAAANCFGQGTIFLYDQQSSTNEGSPPYGAGSTIQNLLPSTGQSFTPGLSGIDFIRLMFDDGNIYDGQGATIFLNLRSDSITGTILGTTAPMTMPNGFTGTENFFFPNTISMTPGITYYFELVLVSGGTWNVMDEPHTYPGGTAFVHGQPDGATDYWFREGILVPEPSAALLGMLGFGVLALVRRQRRM
jgi:MYXO-CTERM domain-containing protein